ncbi:hypothetical protein KIPB_009749, partial [Kipferlia bialata]
GVGLAIPLPIPRLGSDRGTHHGIPDATYYGDGGSGQRVQQVVGATPSPSDEEDYRRERERERMTEREREREVVVHGYNYGQGSGDRSGIEARFPDRPCPPSPETVETSQTLETSQQRERERRSRRESTETGAPDPYTVPYSGGAVPPATAGPHSVPYTDTLPYTGPPLVSDSVLSPHGRTVGGSERTVGRERDGDGEGETLITFEDISAALEGGGASEGPLPHVPGVPTPAIPGVSGIHSMGRERERQGVGVSPSTPEGSEGERGREREGREEGGCWVPGYESEDSLD